MDYPQVLRSMMQAGKLNQSQLAKRLKTTQPTVSRWLAGSRPLVDQHERIVAEAHRLRVIEGQPPYEPDAADLPAQRTVEVKGYVGAGAKTHFYAVDGSLDEVPAPAGATDKTVAVEIRGNSLGPGFDRWLAYYDDVQSPVTDDLMGKLCVVGLSDERVLVKKITKGRRKGLFKLEAGSGSEPPIEDVPVEWAAPVKLMGPR